MGDLSPQWLRTTMGFSLVDAIDITLTNLRRRCNSRRACGYPARACCVLAFLATFCSIAAFVSIRVHSWLPQSALPCVAPALYVRSRRTSSREVGMNELLSDFKTHPLVPGGLLAAIA